MKKRQDLSQRKVVSASLEASFAEVVDLIQQARQHALQAVNTELIDLYWQIGEYISRQTRELQSGVKAWLSNWRATLLENILTSKDSLAVTCFGCASSTRYIEAIRKSHHWCDNCRGPIICSFFSRAKRSEERDVLLRLCLREALE